MRARHRIVLGSVGSVLALLGCNAVLGLGDYSVGPADGTDSGSDVVGDNAAPDADVDAGDKCAVPNKPTIEITEVAQDTTLTCDKEYLLVNQVYVRAGATLTIEAGTVVKGRRGADSEFDKVSVLVVQPGGKIQALGTADKPIVFTSNAPDGQKKPGDWGGVVVLGNAVVNQGTKRIEGVGIAGNDIVYGGNNDDDDSGTLKYVRIEYGGFKLSDNNEINGLTFGGVGRKTTVDYVQVRMVLDDCFEFFGGTVNASHLACQYGQDDGIDWDFGYRGKIQFAVVQQDPNIYDDMNGFEADNGGNPAEWVKTPVSEPTIYNVTLCGPGKATPPRPDGGSFRIRYGMLLRRHTKAHIFNTIIMGFEAGIDVAQYPNFADAGTPLVTDAKSSLELKNIVFWGNTHAVGDNTANIAFAETNGGSGIYADDDQGYDERAEILAGIGNRETDPQIAGCFDPKTPSFGPKVEISAQTVVPPDDEFFIPVGYIGAFKDVNDPWATSGKWAVWDDK